MKFYRGYNDIVLKAYNTIDRHGIWQMLKVYGIGGKLLKAVQSFYVHSRACVRAGNDVSECFAVKVGLRQGCVKSPWLFNVYMDGVVREVNVRVLAKGLELLSANGSRFEINRLFFADDTAPVADSDEKLLFCLGLFGRAGLHPIKGNKLLGSLVVPMQSPGCIAPGRIWSRGTSTAKRRHR